MKRILSRTVCFLVWLLLFPVSVRSQAIDPVFSTEESPRWLYVQFASCYDYLSDLGAGNRLKTAIPDYADGKWILIGDADGFIMKSSRGNYAGWDSESTRFVAVAALDDAVRLKLRAGTSVGYWEIQRDGSAMSMNRFQGNWGDGSLSEWTAGDVENQLFFKEEVTDVFTAEDALPSLSFLLQFTDGEYCLSDTGEKNLRTATKSPTDAGQQWNLVGTADGFVLKNRNGRYAGYDGTNFTAVATRDEAASFRLAAGADNSWEIQRVGTTGVSMNQAGGGGNGKLLCEWTAGESNNRLRLVQVFVDTDQLELPRFSTASDTVWYNVSFRTDDFRMEDCGNAANLVANASTATPVHLFAQMWMLKGNREDFVLCGKFGMYVAWDADASRFVGSFSVDNAAHLRLMANPYTGKWEIQRVDGGGSMAMAASGAGSQLQETQSLAVNNAVSFLPSTYVSHRVLHKQSWMVDRVAQGGMSDEEKAMCIGPDEGYIYNEYTGERLQNTSVYRIVHYMKPGGGSRAMRLPSVMSSYSSATKHNAYQRWYNYKTGMPVEPYMVNSTSRNIRVYENGLVMGAGVSENGGTYYVQTGLTFLKLPAGLSEYVLAADVSRYKDFYSNKDGAGNMEEPSLSARYLFVVKDANEVAARLTACKSGSDDWYETKDITLPAKWTGFAKDVIGIEMELWNYWFYRDGIPGNDNLQNISAEQYLHYELDTSGGAMLRDLELQNPDGKNFEERRFFAFSYPEGGVVEGTGKYAYLKVYAVDGENKYQLARIKLNFLANSEARPYTDIIGYKTDADGTVAADSTFKSMRSPEYMASLCGDPVASIRFTNFSGNFRNPVGGSNVPVIGGSLTEVPNTHAFPLKYDQTNYAYCASDNLANYTAESAWGEYTLVSRYKAQWEETSAGGGYAPVFRPVRAYYDAIYDNSPQHTTEADRLLYIDASEQPGRIANIEFNGNLCVGTRIYCSAWIASPNKKTETVDKVPASVLFEFRGIRKEKDEYGEREEDVLFTFYSGQIVTYGRGVDGSVVYPSKDLSAKMELGDENAGVWQQLAFSFIPDRLGVEYERFVLSIDNNCYGSNGGDILLDDINVFVGHPDIDVEQSSPVCGQTVQLMKVTTEFESLLSSMGLREGETHEKYDAQVWYCFLDKDVYDGYKTLDESGNLTMPADKYAEAFEKALLGSTAESDAGKFGEYAYHNVVFSSTFENDEAQPEWDFQNVLENMPDNVRVFRETTPEGMRKLIFNDKITDEKILPGHEYYIVFVPLGGHNHEWNQAPHLFFDVENTCTVKSTFTARSSSIVKVDGDVNLVIDDSFPYCAGSTPTITVDLPNVTSGGNGTSADLCHDWWLGSVADYKAVVSGDLRLDDAIYAFRHYYPDAASLDDVAPREATDDGSPALTQEMIKLIQDMTQPKDNGEGVALPAPLHLYQASVNVALPVDAQQGSVYKLTVIPIERTVEQTGTLICYEPSEVAVVISGNAPFLMDGLPGKTYPGYMENVPVRIMLSQCRRAAVSGASTLRVPLNKMELVKETSDGMKLREDDSSIYLAGTDDPAYIPQIVRQDDRGNDLGLLPVGRMEALHASRSGDTLEGDCYADIRFDDGFSPREGYTYTLKAWYKENVATGVESEAPCDGTLVFDMKVVPEYEVWTGAAGNDDWTNDRNWARADRDDLHAGNGGLDDYETNEANTTSKGFVPMRYTNAVLPTQTSTEGIAVPVAYPSLYDVSTASGGFPDFDAKNATPDIEYDMVVKNPDAGNPMLTCEKFVPYVVDGILFQPGAELLRSDRLDYVTAAVEYELAAQRWYTLGSPLQGMYAGDWYAPSETGRQETTYFFPISYYSTDKNNRFKPAVYQRTWGKNRSSAKVYRIQGDGSGSGYGENPEEVAMVADWSQVYNDVTVPYDLGGFSVKVDMDRLEGQHSGTSLFRFPKSDVQYTYYTVENDTDGRTQEVRRDVSHRLYSDTLRNEGTLELDLSDSEDLYFLVANPFICGLDMDKFFDRNTWLERKYWLMTAEGQKVVMRNETTAGWVTVGGSDGSKNVAPLQAFFVKKADGADVGRTVRFTADMMTSALSSNVSLLSRPRREASVAQNGLQITATRDGYGSSALVMTEEKANDGYDPCEDTETLLDSNTEDVPTVYTISAGRAFTINCLKQVRSLPLGVESISDRNVTLRFDGVEALSGELMLYDALSDESMPLYSGAEVVVPGKTSGRYFLITALTPPDELPEGIRIDVAATDVTLSASAGTPLRHVSVVDTGGRLVYDCQLNTDAHSFRLQKGVYIVKAATEKEVVTRKIMLR